MRFAIATLKEIDTLQSDSIKREVIFYKGAINFYTENYVDAKQCWLRLAADDSMRQYWIVRLFRENERINRLKPGVAIALSAVLPGAGQVYAGDIGDGVNSLALNAALFVLAYHTAIAYNLFNAIVAVVPWNLRYYEGGFLRAGEIVKEKRAQRHQEIYRQLLEVLQR